MQEAGSARAAGACATYSSKAIAAQAVKLKLPFRTAAFARITRRVNVRNSCVISGPTHQTVIEQKSFGRQAMGYSGSFRALSHQLVLIISGYFTQKPRARSAACLENFNKKARSAFLRSGFA